jgi:catechol 2,3-dioxygenase-like lactoylglutathione lyase family enzyme
LLGRWISDAVTQPYVSIITLACGDAARSRRFYGEGFGWQPVFEADEIAFYQLNGLLLGLYRSGDFARDMAVERIAPSGGFALAYNVRSEAEVTPLMDQLLASGGTLVRAADAPPHGGLRGYVADPDGHPWEIAWNPAFPIDASGNITFPEGLQ